MPKVTIVRSFSKTKQVASFEPINAFCSVSVEDESGAMPSEAIDSEKGTTNVMTLPIWGGRKRSNREIDINVGWRMTIAAGTWSLITYYRGGIIQKIDTN